MKNVLTGIALSILFTTPTLAKPGAAKNLGKREWPTMDGMVVVDGKIYFSSGTTLMISDAAGKTHDLYSDKNPDRGGVGKLTVFDGKLFGFRGSSLVKIDPNSGKAVGLNDGWREPEAMAGLDGKLYAVSDGALWETDPSNGKYTKLGEWSNVHGMVALDGKLYAVMNRELLLMDKKANVTKLADNLGDVLGLTGAFGKLYFFSLDDNNATGSHDSTLHEFDLATKKDTRIPLPADWHPNAGITGMAILGDKLYLAMSNGGPSITLYTIDVK